MSGHGLWPMTAHAGGGERQAGRRFARAGTTIPAATTCVSISTSFEPVVASAITSGTSDTTVSTTVLTTNVWRGRRAHLLNDTAMTAPITAPIIVSWAKPSSGICSPSMASGTSAARAMAAMTVVATAAAAPETRPATQSARARVVRAGASVVFVLVVMVLVLMVLVAKVV